MADTQELTMPTRPAGKQAEQDRPMPIPVPIISKALYQKAHAHNDQLTKLERLLLLSRCDVPGKALAHPTTITEAERNQILRRPPPALLEANIRAITNNGMSTIPELINDEGRSLDQVGLCAVMTSFWTRETRGLQGIQSPEFRGDANNAASRLHELPAERALHHEVIRRLNDPALRSTGATGREPLSIENWRMLKREKKARMQEMAKTMEERHAHLVRERGRVKAEMSARVLAELESLSEAEMDEMQELRERMRVERDRELEEDAREAARKAAERKREIETAQEEAKEEARRRRRKRRAALQAKYGDADYSDSDSNGGESEEGQFPTSEDTW